ncbi:MAG: DUF433 domain-containing protein [Gemmatimonadota bacterium]
MNPNVVSGTPVFAGTLVPIQALLDHLEAGDPLDKFLDVFSSVSRAQAIRFIELAGETVLERVAGSTR